MKEIHHRIYRLDGGKFRVSLQRDRADVMKELKNAEIIPANTPDGDVVVSDSSLEALLAAFGFNCGPYRIDDQGRSILITEPVT